MKRSSIPAAVLAELFLLCAVCLLFIWQQSSGQSKMTAAEQNLLYQKDSDSDFIKWVDFNVTCQVLEDAYQYDLDTHGTAIELHWIELLAVLACKNGGNFTRYQTKDMRALADILLSGKETIESLTEGMSHYDYYYEAYSAVLGGMVGNYKIQVAKNASHSEDASLSEEFTWEHRYGLKCFLPIAKNFPYSDYDDFGVSRSYGYARKHLGHDMMGQTGTPIIAVESGYVEAIGWNQYGGWRLGIRSFDGRRYYYYAHLRQNFPYSLDLEEGSVVTAGDVIGYMGRTGYSAKENTNNIDTPHLHFGIQLIFDESQKEGNGEIWIDCYQLIRFLYRNRSETIRNDETKEWRRILDMIDPAAEEYLRAHTE